MIGLDKIIHICYNKNVNGDGTHQKKRSHIICKFNTKGATPIEKNVIVVDEQGKEYEATYPKRAKGLVKSGRARFVAENKICLACPPNQYLEDKKMEENKLTAREIFTQITILQKELTENSYTSLHRLDDAVTSLVGEGEESEARYAQVAEICEVFKTREQTLMKMLEMYEKMYDELSAEQANAEVDPAVRQQFLDFVVATTSAASPAVGLPDFAEIWNTVFLGK